MVQGARTFTFGGGVIRAPWMDPPQKASKMGPSTTNPETTRGSMEGGDRGQGGCPRVQNGRRQGIGRGGGHLLGVRVHLSQTLIKTEYWDRAGGGGNISYDW